ncbi:MBL fold metallo-hydrolase [Paenibacillus lentus]|uniref:MBL fold metallo-hydrolase n=1 Tax=Paenibacillus lentus TaxID=1338368 RepID=A0A3Q8SDQ8_9BACL|nr:MBL fold metallo-hydrolase [Paenibacillus lentus]AZK48338.1 MBL fold metallo-hydrolase [Paenibacillus lentus]
MISERFQEWAQAGLIQIPITMAPPLRQVNSYLLRGPEGVTIIDPGPRTEVTEKEWEAVWRELEIHPSEISSIVLTHHHPDHFGLAGYLQSLTQAQVYMSARAYEEAERMWGIESTINEELSVLFRQHGMPDEWLMRLPQHLHGFIAQVTPFPKATFVTEDQFLTMGGRRWEPIMSGGHAPGHMSFYDRDKKIMICGDAVLPQISPNISLLPGSETHPLKAFISGLERLHKYDVRMAFPGHRSPFDYFHERISLLIQHHEQRLLRMEQLLRNEPLTGFQVCSSVFGTKLGIHQMRFAMSETLAHLTELVRQGRVAKQDSAGGKEIRFSARQQSCSAQ